MTELNELFSRHAALARRLADTVPEKQLMQSQRSQLPLQQEHLIPNAAVESRVTVASEAAEQQDAVSPMQPGFAHKSAPNGSMSVHLGQVPELPTQQADILQETGVSFSQTYSLAAALSRAFETDARRY